MKIFKRIGITLAAVAVLWGLFTLLVMPPASQYYLYRLVTNARALEGAQLPADLARHQERLREMRATVTHLRSPEYRAHLKSIVDEQNRLKADLAQVAQDIAPLDAQVRELNAEIARLTTLVGETEKFERGQLGDSVADASKKAGALKSRIDALKKHEGTIKRLTTSLQETESSLAPLRGTENGLLVNVRDLRAELDRIKGEVDTIERGVSGLSGNLSQQVSSIETTIGEVRRKLASISGLVSRFEAARSSVTPLQRQGVAEAR